MSNTVLPRVASLPLGILSTRMDHELLLVGACRPASNCTSVCYSEQAVNETGPLVDMHLRIAKVTINVSTPISVPARDQILATGVYVAPIA